MTLTRKISSLQLQQFATVKMNLESAGWWSQVPALAGWYAVQTDTPIAVLRRLLVQKESKWYDIPTRIDNAKVLLENGMAFSDGKKKEGTVVYFGEGKNLKARAREHTHGNRGTACLGLSQYATLYGYSWSFKFKTVKSHVPFLDDDKLLRTVLEQRWRSENGWPLLCTQ
jgi:hypothetical protein